MNRPVEFQCIDCGLIWTSGQLPRDVDEFGDPLDCIHRDAERLDTRPDHDRFDTWREKAIE